MIIVNLDEKVVVWGYAEEVDCLDFGPFRVQGPYVQGRARPLPKLSGRIYNLQIL